MNVDAYAQETEFIMRIRPRGGRIFEAELYAGGVEGPLVIGKLGYSPREVVEALIPPMNADSGVTDSLLTPRLRFEEGVVLFSSLSWLLGIWTISNRGMEGIAVESLNALLP